MFRILVQEYIIIDYIGEMVMNKIIVTLWPFDSCIVDETCFQS